jgi:Mg2+ and Co2+ transporter CorA
MQVIYMALFGFFKRRKKKHRTVPRTVQQSIPYTTVFADGTIETLPGTYTRAYRLEDVSFKIAPDEEQDAIFKAYGNLLDTFPPEVRFQVIIHNHSADKRQSFENIRYKPQKDGLNRYRREINNILIEKLTAGGNVTQDKYLVVSAESETIGEAMETLSRIEKDVERAVKKITRDVGIKRLSAEERLSLLFDIYNQDGSNVFYTGTDKSGTPVFDYDSLGRAGLTTKDVIGPSGMEFFPGYFMLGEAYGRALFIEHIPNELSSEYMSDLSEILPNMIISVHHTPIEMSKGVRLIRDHMLAINAQMYVSQQDAYRRKYSYDLISPELVQSQKQTRDLLDDVSIEMSQAIEMCSTYSNILNGTMDAFGNIINNNMNITMRTLAILTLVLSIPNMVYGFYGMNTPLPHDDTWVFAFALSVAATVGATVILMRSRFVR